MNAGIDAFRTFTLLPGYLFCAGLLGILFLGSAWRWRQQRRRASHPLATGCHNKDNKAGDTEGLKISPLEDFDWQTTDPLQLRPFRGKDRFYLTMAIETLNPSELIPMDKTYKDRLAHRVSLLAQHRDIVVAVNEHAPNQTDPRIRAAVSELYSFVLGSYLPTRYPSMFRVRLKYANDNAVSSTAPSDDSGTAPDNASAEPANADDDDFSSGAVFENLVTGDIWPCVLSPSTPTVRALEILVQTVDEDFLILLPDTDSNPGSSSGSGLDSDPPIKGKESVTEPKYILQAYATCFPSGFNTREKLGLRLADIHRPVPGYKTRLERSMDRFFARVEVGRFVSRVNWSVTTDADLFAAFGGTHGRVAVSPDPVDEGVDMQDEEDVDEEEAIRPGDLNIDRTVLRCERQTLHRLPDSKALVFAFHTYTYPIRQIKDEGLGEELAVAIDGLRAGNVPQIYSYKRGHVWGEAVKEFLRS